MAKISYRELERRYKRMIAAVNNTMEELLHRAATDRMLAEILEDVLHSDIDLKEFRTKWEEVKNSDKDPAQIAEYLGLENLQDNFNEIWVEYRTLAEIHTIKEMS